MKLNKIFKQNNFWLSLITIVAVGIFLPNLNAAFADSSVIGKIVGWLIFYVLFFPFTALFRLELIILPIIAQFNNFTHLAGVVTGWTILRDLSNMFFIVVLLFMAFATILKISSYGYKELLKTLIIMAILINFSKTIVGLLIDIGQVVMLTFVAAIKDVAAGNLTAMFGVDDIVKVGTNVDGKPAEVDVGFTQIVLAYLLGGIMVMLASIVLMAFIVMLVMRVIFLWILVVLSPLAFLANTFPSTKKYFGQWLSNLGKEIIVGPVLIFFLWLSLTIMNSDVTGEFTAQSIDSQGQGNESLIGKNANISFTAAGEWDNVLKYIIALGMLIGSLKVAQSIGSSAMAYGDKAAAKLKSTASSAYKFAGNRAWKGSTGEGGLSGGLQRAGSNVGVKALDKLGSSKFTPVIIGGFATRAAARVQGAEDKRKQRKQAKIEDRYKDIRDERKEAVYASRGGSYSARALDKIEIEKGKLKEKTPQEIIEMTKRARALNDTATVTKLENAHAMANTAEGIAAAIQAGKGQERYAKMNLEGTYEKNADGIVTTAKEGTKAYEQGQMLAKGFLELTGKEQDEVKKGMDASSWTAMLEYVKTLDSGSLDSIDEKNKEKAYTDKQKEIIEPDLDEQGNQKEDKDGNKLFKSPVIKHEQDINESSVHWKRAALLGKYKSGEANTAEVYNAAVARSKAAAGEDKKEKVDFKSDSAEKALAKTMTGADLVKIHPSSQMFEKIAKHLTMGQMTAMNAEAAGGGHVRVAVEAKSIEAAANLAKAKEEKDPIKRQDKIADALGEIRKLLASQLTRDHVPDFIRKLPEVVADRKKKGLKQGNEFEERSGESQEQGSGRANTSSPILAPSGRSARDVLAERDSRTSFANTQQNTNNENNEAEDEEEETN